MAKSSWQYMIGSTHTNSYNNGILHMHIICPIKINHLSLHQLSKKLWTTFKINNIILNIQRGAKNHHAYKNTSTFCFSIMTHSRTRLVFICVRDEHTSKWEKKTHLLRSTWSKCRYHTEEERKILESWSMIQQILQPQRFNM